jgi:hypothetical protein
MKPVTLSAAKGLARRTQRSFAALRMTARLWHHVLHMSLTPLLLLEMTTPWLFDILVTAFSDIT